MKITLLSLTFLLCCGTNINAMLNWFRTFEKDSSDNIFLFDFHGLKIKKKEVKRLMYNSVITKMDAEQNAKSFILSKTFTKTNDDIKMFVDGHPARVTFNKKKTIFFTTSHRDITIYDPKGIQKNGTYIELYKISNFNKKNSYIVNSHFNESGNEIISFSTTNDKEKRLKIRWDMEKIEKHIKNKKKIQDWIKNYLTEEQTNVIHKMDLLKNEKRQMEILKDQEKDIALYEQKPLEEWDMKTRKQHKKNKKKIQNWMKNYLTKEQAKCMESYEQKILKTIKKNIQTKKTFLKELTLKERDRKIFSEIPNDIRELFSLCLQ